MKVFLDFLPLLLFFAAFRLFNIYVATGVAIAASILQVSWLLAKRRKVEPVHWITLFVIVIFGGLTLALRNDTFIKWKPTMVNGVLGLIILGSQVLGKRPAIQMLLSSQLRLPDAIWRRLNLHWGLFFLALAALNVYVAFYYGRDLPEEVRTSRWVNFKVFGLFGLTIVFTLVEMLSLSRYLKGDEADPHAPESSG
jgi:intracellular septation protein